MMTLGIHCLYIPHVPWIYIVMMILGIHCYDDPGLTLLVLIDIIIPYKPCTHTLL